VPGPLCVPPTLPKGALNLRGVFIRWRGCPFQFHDKLKRVLGAIVLVKLLEHHRVKKTIPFAHFGNLGNVYEALGNVHCNLPRILGGDGAAKKVPAIGFKLDVYIGGDGHALDQFGTGPGGKWVRGRVSAGTGTELHDGSGNSCRSTGTVKPMQTSHTFLGRTEFLKNYAPHAIYTTVSPFNSSSFKRSWSFVLFFTM
jgi:hypothetical protein